MQITICAFTDRQPNSISYRKFDDIEKAVEFYRKMLKKDFCNVISTRKIE
jgi:pentatricopeptide repeat protein